MTEPKEVLSKAIDTIKLVRWASQQITFERKERLKMSLLRDYEYIWYQDYSGSFTFLQGNDLVDNLRRTKATHALNKSISIKKQRISTSLSERCLEVSQAIGLLETTKK